MAKIIYLEYPKEVKDEEKESLKNIKTGDRDGMREKDK